MNQQRVNNPPNAARTRRPRRWPSRAPCIPRKATLVKRRTPTPRLGPPAARRRRRGRIMGLPRSEPFATSLLRLRPQPANRAVPHPPRSPNGTAAGGRRNNCSAEEKRHVAGGGRSETGRGGGVMGDFCLRARQSLVHPRQRSCGSTAIEDGSGTNPLMRTRGLRVLICPQGVASVRLTPGRSDGYPTFARSAPARVEGCSNRSCRSAGSTLPEVSLLPV